MSKQQPADSMEASIEEIIGRPLTTDERQMFMRLRDKYGYNDGDPLAVVLSMTGAVSVLTHSIPARIQEAAQQMIELHASVLRSQAELVAKDLVGTVAQAVYSSGRSRLRRVIEGVAFFGAGAVVASAGFLFFIFR